ncbi:Cna B-type domain-containing protein [Olsenella sp. YH-ols2221]|uniref:Cna B-type domain-containing protein n=1 Tax=Olsenella kribbiana TaxID=3115221 RepID=UPI002ED8DB4D
MKRAHMMSWTGRSTIKGFCGLVLAAAMALAVALVPASAFAAQSPSIEIQGCKAEGQEFHAYLLASMDEEGTLANEPATDEALKSLGYSSDSKAMSPETFDSATPAADLRTAAETLSGYVASAPAEFKSYDAAVKGGVARFSGLDEGLYLIVADQNTVSGITYTASPMLVTVPETVQVADGTHAVGSRNYDVTVAAKMAEQEQPTKEWRVTKLWKDDGQKRPSSVTVAILDGTSVYREVTLDASNDWTFAWEGEGDWSVRELDVPEGYASSVSKVAADDAETSVAFELTNTEKEEHKTPKGELADMGDTNRPALVLALLAGGAILFVAGVALQHRNGQKS